MYLISISKCLPNQFRGGRQVPTHPHLHFYLFKKTKFKRDRQEPTCFACISNRKEIGVSLPHPPSPPLPSPPPLVSSSLFKKLKVVDIYLTFLHVHAFIKIWKMVGICLPPHPILHLNALKTNWEEEDMCLLPFFTSLCL
jgi:hypothetical protein